MLPDFSLFNLDQLNPLPGDKTLDQTKLKAFADNKLNETKNDNFCL